MSITLNYSNRIKVIFRVLEGFITTNFLSIKFTLHFLQDNVVLYIDFHIFLMILSNIDINIVNI